MSFVRADLMMAARPGTDPAELEGLLAGSARRALAGPGGRTGVRVAAPARTRTAGSTPAAAGQSNAAAARFDAVVSAGAPSAAACAERYGSSATGTAQQSAAVPHPGPRSARRR